MSQQSLVKIEDYQQVVTKIYSYISVSITNVVLNTSVDVQVMIYDSNQNMIDLKLLHRPKRKMRQTFYKK